MSKLLLFHNELVKDYIDVGLGLRDLEKKYGVNRHYIKSYFINHNIPIKKHKRISNPVQKLLNNKEWLEQKYKETKTTQAIASFLGVSKTTVCRYMNKHNIVMSGYTQTNNNVVTDFITKINSNDYLLNYISQQDSHKPRKQELCNKEFVEQLYKRRMNIRKCALELKISYPTFANALYYHNIPIVYSSNKSLHEYELINHFNNYKIIHSYKIDTIELDIFFPDYNLAIEINGLRFHSEILGKKLKYYHQNKYEICKKHGIKLFQF